MATCVEMRGIRKSFWGVEVLHGIDLAVNRGEVHALVGSNGAGKSTLIKILSGAIAKDAGEMALEGSPYAPLNPAEARARGVATIYQELTLLPELTIYENVFLGRELTRWGLTDLGRMRREARRLLGSLGIDLDPDRRVRGLGIGEQYMIEIAKSLFANARLVILDEPTAAMTPIEAGRLFAAITSLKATGVSFIYISHRLEEVHQIADRVTVLRDGLRVDTQAVRDVTREDLIEKMVGRLDGATFSAGDTDGPILLEAQGLTWGQKLRHVSLVARAGQVLGVTGLLGAGKTELAMALFAPDRQVRGRVLLDGKPVAIRTPSDAIRCGIGLVPEDRKNQGLILAHLLRENVALCNLDLVETGRFFVDRTKEISLTTRLTKALNIIAAGPDQVVGQLSGGNQQKVVLAKWLARDCQVLIMDEPTRGIDVGAKEEIYRLIDQLRRKGKAVILMSSEIPEIVRLSDHIIVLRSGSVVARLRSDEASPERVAQYAAG